MGIKDDKVSKFSEKKLISNLWMNAGLYHLTKNVMDGIKEILDPINNQKLNPTAAEFSNISKMVENVRIF